jgi:hypothetical protein
VEQFVAEGLRAVGEAIVTYRGGGQLTSDDQIAWLAVHLEDLRVRDDAWARMDPEHTRAHLRLWTDVVRRTPAGYIPAPASLLAFTAWQAGNGALANVAALRALAADPDYSMALLLQEAISAGAPPSAARLPMTPEEVAASYAHTQGRRMPGSSPHRSAAHRPRGQETPAPRTAARPGRRGPGSARVSARPRPAARAARPAGAPPGSAARPRAARPAAR